MKPMDIEKQSFAIIEKELTTDIPPEYKPVVKRVIHTTADFSYETSMMFSDGVIEKALMAIREGTEIVTEGFQYGTASCCICNKCCVYYASYDNGMSQCNYV